MYSISLLSELTINIMVYIRHIILLLFFCSSFFSQAITTSSYTSAATTKTVKKSTTKKQKNNKFKNKSTKQKQNKDGKYTTVPPSGPRQFEGELYYASFQSMNNLMKNLMFGQGYNGERDFKVLIKNDLIHINNETMHQHVIIDKNNNCWIYDDITKKGLRGDTALLKFIGMPSLEGTYNGFKISSKISLKPEKTKYNGVTDNVYEGMLTTHESNNTYFEFWSIDQFLAVPNIKYLVHGFFDRGIIHKGFYSSIAKVPLFGDAKIAFSIELTAFKERPIDFTEINAPADISFDLFRDNSQYTKFLKENTKALKKAKLYPKKMKSKEVVTLMNKEWGFAKNWINRRSEYQDTTLTWKKVINTASDLTNSIANNLSHTKSTREQSLINNSVTDSKEVLNESDWLDTRVELNKLEKVNLDFINSPIFGKSSDRTAKDALKSWEIRYTKLRNWITEHDHNGKIPKQAYLTYYDQLEAQNEALHKRKMASLKAQIKRTKKMAKSLERQNYSMYEHELIMWHDYPTRYLKPWDEVLIEIRDYQNKMREVRQKNSDIKKSKWENWNGVPGSMK